jgi:hypothetical protein
VGMVRSVVFKSGALGSPQCKAGTVITVAMAANFLQRVAEQVAARAVRLGVQRTGAQKGLTKVDVMGVMVGNTKNPKWGQLSPASVVVKCKQWCPRW